MKKKELLRRIEALEAKLSISKEEPKELEVGKWYWVVDILIYVNKLYKDAVFGYGLNTSSNFWIEGDDPWYAMQITHEATTQEVEEALIKEAKRRGFHKGYESGKYIYFINKSDYYYNKEAKTLYVKQFGNTWNMIFKNGVWADVIKNDDKPKVGDVVKAWDDSEDVFTIGKIIEIEHGIGYRINDGMLWENAKKLSQQEVIELLFGK